MALNRLPLPLHRPTHNFFEQTNSAMNATVTQLEAEASNATQALIRMMESQGKEWQSAASLRSLAAVAASEADVVRAKLEAVRQRSAAAASNAAAAAAATAAVRSRELELTAAALQLRADLAFAATVAQEQAQYEADVRAESARAAAELALLETSTEVERGITAAKAAVRRAAAAVHAQESAAAARANEGLALARVALRGEAARAQSAAVIETTFALLQAGAVALAAEPLLLLRCTALLLGLAAVLLCAQFGAKLCSELVERRFARPALVRETSRSGSRLAECVGWIVPGANVALTWWRQFQKRQSQKRHCLQGIALPPAVETRVLELIESIQGAHARGSALRHILLQGPPGTGAFTSLALHI
jgi:Domain of unknown function (DUF3523)